MKEETFLFIASDYSLALKEKKRKNEKVCMHHIATQIIIIKKIKKMLTHKHAVIMHMYKFYQVFSMKTCKTVVTTVYTTS